MPELPEVETYTRYFEKHALHRRIARIVVKDERILATRRERLTRALRRRSFERVQRHGKHLFADGGNGWLHLHFGMSGDLLWYRRPGDEPRFARVVFDFADGSHLAYDDMRLFGVVELVPSPEAYIEEHRLGPDPLEPSFRLPAFRKLLGGRKGAIKSLLMTQEVIAGVGNLYADEALYQSSINPRRAVDSLTDVEVRRLHSKLQSVLREAVARRGSDRELPRRWLFDHREEDARCPMCGGVIRRTVVFGRTTYYCGSHQT